METTMEVSCINNSENSSMSLYVYKFQTINVNERLSMNCLSSKYGVKTSRCCIVEKWKKQLIVRHDIKFNTLLRILILISLLIFITG